MSFPGGQPRGFVFESPAMTHRALPFFFYFFPCHLADGTG